MLDETTISTLNALKIFGMAKSLPERLADPRVGRGPPEPRISAVIRLARGVPARR